MTKINEIVKCMETTIDSMKKDYGNNPDIMYLDMKLKELDSELIKK